MEEGWRRQRHADGKQEGAKREASEMKMVSTIEGITMSLLI
jgi:hypothetical protein